MLLNYLDVVLSGSVIGATAWFFFVQSPVLIKMMGRDRFTPIQMRLTKILFQTLTIATALIVVLSFLGGGGVTSLSFLGAVVGLLGAAINKYLIVPRALIAGGKGRMEEKDKADDKSVQSFAVEGAGPAAKTMHQTVVLFVVVMLGGLAVHLWAM
jgi:energy-converting hydrogenase Eha subunit A